MNQRYQILYTELLNDLSRCQSLDLPEPEIVESSCQLAMNHWLELRKTFTERVKGDPDEEIYFFKYVKPRFTSHYEYYLIVSQALLFPPVEPESLGSYWKEETNRYRRFYERNKVFISYYDTGGSEEDSHYFLMENYRQEIPPQERIYKDEDCRTQGDPVVRGLLANSMYHEFALKKLEECGGKTEQEIQMPLYHQAQKNLLL